jgi:hypothetical protein
MEIRIRWRFADVVLDLNEVVALVTNTVYLRDGRKMDVGVAAADALRKATPPYPELPQGIRDTGKDNLPSCVPTSRRQRTSQAKASKAQAQLQHRS